MRSIGWAAEWGIGRVVGLVEGVAFWTGVALPFLYLPFVVFGTGVTFEFRTLLGLLAVNYVALFVGAGHRHGDGPTSDTGD